MKLTSNGVPHTLIVVVNCILCLEVVVDGYFSFNPTYVFSWFISEIGSPLSTDPESRLWIARNFRVALFNVTLGQLF